MTYILFVAHAESVFFTGLHYLSLLWGACLMYHAPQRIYWLIGVPLVTYSVDRLVGMFRKTHLVENTYFERLGDTYSHFYTNLIVHHPRCDSSDLTH